MTRSAVCPFRNAQFLLRYREHRVKIGHAIFKLAVPSIRTEVYVVEGTSAGVMQAGA